MRRDRCFLVAPSLWLRSLENLSMGRVGPWSLANLRVILFLNSVWFYVEAGLGAWRLICRMASKCVCNPNGELGKYPLSRLFLFVC